MKQFTYHIQTISSLVVSPRDHHGFYLAARDFQEKDIRKFSNDINIISALDKVNIIYPFYQYGEYPKYDPEHAQNYIPGSSIKGAILSTKADKETIRLLVDDIPIKASDLRLTPLYKLQNFSVDSEQAIELGVFFPNVAVEMLSHGSNYTGEMFGSDADIRNYLHHAQHETKEKLKNFIQILNIDEKRMIKEKTKELIQDVLKNVNEILMEIERSNDSYIILAGGYKGLTLSRTFTEAEEVKGAVYLDMSTKLPHGLISLTP